MITLDKTIATDLERMNGILVSFVQEGDKHLTDYGRSLANRKKKVEEEFILLTPYSAGHEFSDYTVWK